MRWRRLKGWVRRSSGEADAVVVDVDARTDPSTADLIDEWMLAFTMFTQPMQPADLDDAVRITTERAARIAQLVPPAKITVRVSSSVPADQAQRLRQVVEAANMAIRRAHRLYRVSIMAQAMLVDRLAAATHEPPEVIRQQLAVDMQRLVRLGEDNNSRPPSDDDDPDL